MKRWIALAAKHWIALAAGAWLAGSLVRAFRAPGKVIFGCEGATTT